MSLICHECGYDLEPSKELPGREGTLVYPVLPSLVWLPEKPGLMSFTHMEGKPSRTLCFTCLKNKLSEERSSEIDKIFKAFLAEVEFNMHRSALAGKWIEGGSPEDLKRAKLYEELEKAQDDLTTDCLFCGKELPENNLPHFIARVLDKVKMQPNLSFCGSYQWSNLETGRTRFNICRDCHRDLFPKNYEQLSFDVRGVDRNNLNAKSEFVISQGALAAMAEEMGADEVARHIQRLKDMGVDVKF